MKYRRILLKLSGETLAGPAGPLDPSALAVVSQELKSAAAVSSLAVVVGGGNIWRGAKRIALTRAAADYIGMYATVVNALALKESLLAAGVAVEAVSAVSKGHYLGDDSPETVRRFLSDGKTVIFAGGTGRPFFTTDTAAALRSCEIGADVLIKATQVDGVYDSDPMSNPAAKKYETLSYDEAITKKLAVMDTAAFSLCREGKIPIIVYDFSRRGALASIASGEKMGTLIGERT